MHIFICLGSRFHKERLHNSRWSRSNIPRKTATQRKMSALLADCDLKARHCTLFWSMSFLRLLKWIREAMAEIRMQAELIQTLTTKTTIIYGSTKPGARAGSLQLKQKCRWILIWTGLMRPVVIGLIHQDERRPDFNEKGDEDDFDRGHHELWEHRERSTSRITTHSRRTTVGGETQVSITSVKIRDLKFARQTASHTNSNAGKVSHRLLLLTCPTAAAYTVVKKG